MGQKYSLNKSWRTKSEVSVRPLSCKRRSSSSSIVFICDQLKALNRSLCSNFDPDRYGKSKIYYIPNKLKYNNRIIDAVGIDLGTTRCCVAVNRMHGIETVALDNKGERLLPSYVAYDEKYVKCGQVVIDRLQFHAKSTVFDSKRMIGKKYNEIRINRFWPFEVDRSDFGDPLVKLESHDNTCFILHPKEISAMLLKHIKQKAEEFQGRKLSEVVITVPASFSIEQKAATREAAKIAEWETIHLLPEPIAAFFSFYIDRPLFIKETVLLFDLGGGTLQVCVMEIQNEQVQIMSTCRNRDIGGRDFDEVLVRYFARKLFDRYGISENHINIAYLMKECQKIKESLSYNDKEKLDVEDVDNFHQRFIKITRKKFESLCWYLLEEIKYAVREALDYSQYDSSNIEKVFVVGGGSRMPMIKLCLQKMFPDVEHISSNHLDECIAVGAAYHAYDIYSLFYEKNDQFSRKKN